MQNMRLPDGRTALLFSIYEAVMNGVHAIEARFKKEEAPHKGRIVVAVKHNREKFITGIAIRDNGIGLNDRHLSSFETCDTTEKLDIGGRGVGRLVWPKVFSEIKVISTFRTKERRKNTIRFQFEPLEEDSLVDLQIEEDVSTDRGTIIVLNSVKREFLCKITGTLIARSLCHHFFPYFIAESMPDLEIDLGKKSININSYINSRISSEQTVSVDLTQQNMGVITLTHVYVDPKIARELSNSILLTAQGRVVESIEIEKKFALKELDNGKAYVCVVKGEFLDSKVDQERTSFKATEEDIQTIKDAALMFADKFLANHISKIRKGQSTVVVNILQEHPQLAVSVASIEDYVKHLSPSMSDEEIGKSLFTLLYRHEKKVRAQIKSFTENEPSKSQEAQKSLNDLVQKVSDDARRRLAEYTVKRHQIVQIARSMLRYSDEDKTSYVWEKALHDLICPMGQILSAKNYSDHNLWLIDDLLSYYQFFASDKAMSALGVDGERKEPDLIFFNPFGFRREGTNDPVVIIEFKRPGDENLTSDPVDQVLGYIDKLRQRTVRSPDGDVISDINELTPFECIVICDLTGSARKRFERSLAQNPTPDGLGYYGFSPHHRASIRVISYQKLFRDAEMRNASFFEQLGLLPQEVKVALNPPPIKAA